MFVILLAAVAGGERRTKYGCEGSSLELECEEGAVISLVRANYGRFSISICNGEGNTAWSVNCMEPRTLRIINTRYCLELTRANPVGYQHRLLGLAAYDPGLGPFIQHLSGKNNIRINGI